MPWFSGHRNSFYGDLRAMGSENESVTTHWFSEAEIEYCRACLEAPARTMRRFR